MLTYELLKIWFNFIELLPDKLCWAIVGAVLIINLFSDKDKKSKKTSLAAALMTLTFGPLLLYGACCLLVSLRGIPLIGILCVIIQLSIDISIIAGIIMLVKSSK